MKISFFYLFSNWLFIWFILFYLNIIIFNPLFFLIVGYIITLSIGINYLPVYKIDTYNLIKFIILNTIFKLIPICLILIKTIYFTLYDIYFGFFIIIIYIIFMRSQNINIYEFYQNLFKTYINNNKANKSDISNLYDNIYNSIIKLKK